MVKKFYNSNFQSLMSEIRTVSGLLEKKGWAERNAGNFSILIDTQEIVGKECGACRLDNTYAALSGKSIIFSASGKRMREVKKQPAENICMITLNNTGNAYSKYILSEDADKDLIPTSELSTHLAIQNLLQELNRTEKVVLHTHPTELIAITQIKELLDEQKLNTIIKGMHPESSLFLPNGVGLIPYKITGSEELANLSLEKFKNHKVALWEKHGAISIGKNLSDAFDYLDIAAKCALIYFMVKQAGFEPQGLSKKQLDELNDPYIKRRFE